MLLAQNIPNYCALDEDGNGLDDDMEQHLAKCFAPEFRFDSQENALKPGEPVLGFSAWRLADDPSWGLQPSGYVRVKIKYEAIWHNDGGFIADGDFGCHDSHEGDNYHVSLILDIQRDNGVWHATPRQFQGFPEGKGDDCPLANIDGTHPVIFMSAGKHHSYCNAGVSTFKVTFGHKCRDSHQWDWLDEVKKLGPTSSTPHFDPGDVVTYSNTPFSSAFKALTYEYAVWTLVELKQAPYTTNLRDGSFFKDPENYPAGKVLLDTTSEQSRRLRSQLSDTPADLASLHNYFPLGPGCTLLTPDQLLHQLSLWWGPDPVSPVSLVSPVLGNLNVLAHDGGLVTDAVLLRPARRDYSTLQLGPRASDSWLATTDVSLAPLGAEQARQLQPRGAVALQATSPGLGSAAPAPDLMVLDAAGSRWARLTPVSIQSGVDGYDVLEAGTLRYALSPDTVLVADVAGKTAVAVDFEAGALEAYSPGEHDWTRLALPAALLGRQGAALALRGPTLLIAGGLSDGEPRGDLWAVDLYGGGSYQLRTDLPARSHAGLSVTPDGSRVLLSGGQDARGRLHDDVWTLASPGHSPGQELTQLYADSSGAVEPAHALLVPERYGSGVLRFRVATDTGAKSVIEARTPSGWQRAGASGKPEACATDDAEGGLLCRVSGDGEWWSNAGRVPCGGSACEGAPGTLARVEHIAGRSRPIAADIDATGLWVLRRRSLERWSVAEDGHVSRIAKIAVPGRARDLAVRAGVALVATSRGVLRARASESGIDAEPLLPLCGRPIHVVPLAGGVWGVQTTLAFTVVGGDAGAPLGILSNSVLVRAGHQRGRAFEMGHDRGTIAACRAADHFAWPRGAGRRRTSALARAGSARALVAFGETLFDLDLSDPSHPVVTSALDLERPLAALRTDPLGARAYGVASGDRDDQGWRHHGRRDRDDREDQGDARPVFDLSGGALKRTGAHRISFWVTRRDKGSVRLRVTHRGVDVAEVAP